MTHVTHAVLLGPDGSRRWLERKFSPKRKFWAGYPCGHPAKNFGQTLQILEKQAFLHGHPARTSMKKLRSEKLRADFSFPRRWRVPNPPGANPLVAERAPWRSSHSRVTGGQQPTGNPYRFLSFLLHTWQPLCDPNSHSQGRLFQLPGG